MTEARIEELTRRWKQTGLIEDEVALLAEKRRLQSLSDVRLDLAAYLGHPAARLLRGAQARGGAPAADRHARSLRRWGLGLRAWGQQSWLRAGCAAMELAIGRVMEDHPEGPAARALLAAIRGWIECPCSDCSKDALALTRQHRPAEQIFADHFAALQSLALTTVTRWTIEIGIAVPIAPSHQEVETQLAYLQAFGALARVEQQGKIIELMLEDHGPDQSGLLDHIRKISGLKLTPTRQLMAKVGFPSRSFYLAARVATPDAICGAIRGALVPWALGLGGREVLAKFIPCSPRRVW